MRKQSYLIDTNILIGLEDNRTVEAVYAKFLNLAAAHKVDVFVHEAARDDIVRDKNHSRRSISLSKIAKYQLLHKQHGLTEEELEKSFGPLRKPNDVVDATLLHALVNNAADFVVTQDKGLHERALRFGADLGRRVLFVGDATELLTQTYEPKKVPIRHVVEVQPHMINSKDKFFDSLREDYPKFDDWWRLKCVPQHRPCWVVYDGEHLAGLIVRKDEAAATTDAISKVGKILKICTFKVAPDKRGVKLGELLLKQVLWYAQKNSYDLAYLTTYKEQGSLINLLEFYGFEHAGDLPNEEMVFERRFVHGKLVTETGVTPYEAARKHYPRFCVGEGIQAFGIPIKETYHDTLYPDLWDPIQRELFANGVGHGKPSRPGNTIRKVYLCRAPSNLGLPGSILFFYKGASKDPPSQSITAIGILESVAFANTTQELMRLSGGRSVYSEDQLDEFWEDSEEPVKVINFLLVSYIDPPVTLAELKSLGIVKDSPPQSIYQIKPNLLGALLERCKLTFPT